MADEKHLQEEQNDDLANRRDFLLATKKWSKIVIGGLLVAGAVATSTRTAHARGSWVNRRGGGGWANRSGGGGWYNRSGGGGGWINGGGGGWYNRGGSWINGGGGGWVNRRGGGGGSWINRR